MGGASNIDKQHHSANEPANTVQSASAPIVLLTNGRREADEIRAPHRHKRGGKSGCGTSQRSTKWHDTLHTKPGDREQWKNGKINQKRKNGGTWHEKEDVVEGGGNVAV